MEETWASRPEGMPTENCGDSSRSPYRTQTVLPRLHPPHIPYTGVCVQGAQPEEGVQVQTCTPPPSARLEFSNENGVLLKCRQTGADTHTEHTNVQRRCVSTKSQCPRPRPAPVAGGQRPLPRAEWPGPRRQRRRVVRGGAAGSATRARSPCCRRREGASGPDEHSNTPRRKAYM